MGDGRSVGAKHFAQSGSGWPPSCSVAWPESGLRDRQYSHVTVVKSLRDRVDAIRGDLTGEITIEFSKIGELAPAMTSDGIALGDGDEEARERELLKDACLVVDALGAVGREG